MKNKHIAILGCCILAISFVLGITNTIDLGSSATAQAKTDDRLIGIMITKESLQLFDFESYFNDHAKDIIKGDNVISETDGYTNRIYAELVDKSTFDEATGQTIHTKEYVFPDTDGWYLYCATVYDAQNSYVTNIEGDGLCDIKSSNHYKDNGEERTMEATLYTVRGSDLYTVYVNPIYQTPTGEVYITEGTGIGGAGGLTKTITETVTIEKDGEEESYTGTFIIHREEIAPPQSVTLTQMDKNNTPLLTESFAAGTLPETFEPDADTAYILVTQQSIDENGNITEHRSLLQPSDENIESFVVTENGVCEKQYTALHWTTESEFAV
ncbi:MAG: hypothetical protein IJO14_03285 [Clostridia bacterium]|nr:hypothetical protein [Clostridia bacterium]